MAFVFSFWGTKNKPAHKCIPLTYQRRRLGAVGHVDSVAGRSDQVWQVGVYVRPGGAGHRVILALGLVEDADEVRHPLLIALPGEQRHDHQLDAQEHEEVASLGVESDHGDGHQAPPRAQQGSKRGDCQLRPVRCSQYTPSAAAK